MNDNDLKATLLRLLKPFAPEADLESMDVHANIQEEIEIDSFDFLNFLIAVDKEIGVSVPEADYGQVMTLEDLMHYLSARVV